MSRIADTAAAAMLQSSLLKGRNLSVAARLFLRDDGRTRSAHRRSIGRKLSGERPAIVRRRRRPAGHPSLAGVLKFAVLDGDALVLQARHRISEQPPLLTTMIASRRR